MAHNIIEVDHLSKVYRLGQIGTGTLSHDLKRAAYRLLGKPDPYATIGKNERTAAGQKGERVYALRDVNLEIAPGEVVGVIGKNGAGKSTLLKVLARITTPSEGEVRMNGRMASLLEVGTGFHPEMTGRENIYLNGTLLGMKKAEIDRKLSDIVDFSGVAKYVDTPVKRYSSGMKVRLAFAVAAFLEPEILIVDEVLAVGDAEFQRQAIGKMQDVSKSGDRTVLFVSHNMASIRELCPRSILMENGEVHTDGPTEQTIENYLSAGHTAGKGVKQWTEQDAPGNSELRLREVRLTQKGASDGTFFSDEPIEVKVTYDVLQPISEYQLKIKVYSAENQLLFGFSDIELRPSVSEVPPGAYVSVGQLPADLFNNKDYRLTISADIYNQRRFFDELIAVEFSVETPHIHPHQRELVSRGPLFPKVNWREA